MKNVDVYVHILCSRVYSAILTTIRNKRSEVVVDFCH